MVNQSGANQIVEFENSCLCYFLHNSCLQCQSLPHLHLLLQKHQILTATIIATTTTLAKEMMMRTMVFELSFFISCVVGEAVLVSVGDAVVSGKRCCTFEMFALMAEEMSAMDDLTIATKTFLVTTAIDDPGGD